MTDSFIECVCPDNVFMAFCDTTNGGRIKCQCMYSFVHQIEILIIQKCMFSLTQKLLLHLLFIKKQGINMYRDYPCVECSCHLLLNEFLKVCYVVKILLPKKEKDELIWIVNCTYVLIFTANNLIIKYFSVHFRFISTNFMICLNFYFDEWLWNIES